MLKSQQRARRFSLFIKLAILGGGFYAYHYYGLPEHAEEKKALVEKAQTKFEDLVLPVVESSVSRMTAKIQADMEKNGTLPKGASIGGTGKAGSKTSPALDVSKLSPEALQMLCRSLPKK